MKIAFVLSLLIAGIPSLLHAAPEPTDQWLAQNAREVAGGFLLPGKGTSPELRMTPAEGVSLGGAPTSGDDKKSLVFNGTQTAAFRTETGYLKASSGIRVIVDVMIPEDRADFDGTILRHGTSWELRHVPARDMVVFVVWHDATEYTEVRVPTKPGEWQTFEATFQEEQLTLTNGRDRDAKTAPTGVRVEPSDPPLLLGASIPVITDPVAGRPFKGSVANIRIGIE